MNTGFTITLMAAACLVLNHLAAPFMHAQDTLPQGKFTVTGIVFKAATSRSIPDATIEIAELTRVVRTNVRGAFLFDNLPAVEYTITVRAIGYAQFRTKVKTAGRRQVEVSIALPRMTALGTTMVVSRIAPEPMEFREARALGLGIFVSHDLLSKSGDRRLGDVLSTTTSVGVGQGRGGRAYVFSKRKGATLRPPPRQTQMRGTRNRPGEDIYYPEPHEVSMGITTACYARVYLDRQLVNPGTPAEPVNINEYHARELVGIESILVLRRHLRATGISIQRVVWWYCIRHAGADCACLSATSGVRAATRWYRSE